ncbi:MAG: hypothetical protein V5A64_05940 [Candidatus Thermoplasmatota archaeon]
MQVRDGMLSRFKSLKIFIVTLIVLLSFFSLPVTISEESPTPLLTDDKNINDNSSYVLLNKSFPEVRYKSQINFAVGSEYVSLSKENYTILDTNNNNLFDTVVCNVSSHIANKLTVNISSDRVVHSGFFSDQVRNDDGTVTAVISGSPQNYYDEKSDTFRPIDVNVRRSDSEGFAFENTKNVFKSFFNRSGRVRFADNGAYIDYHLVDQPFRDMNSDYNLTVDNNTVTYEGVYDGVDVRFSVSSSTLLEEFVVRHPMDVNRVVERFETSNNVSYRLLDDGSIDFYNEDGKCVFRVPSPLMWEENNRSEVCDGLHYEVTRDNGSFFVSKVIDEEGKKWLRSEDRSYPVVIDASTEITAMASDGYISHSDSQWSSVHDASSGSSVSDSDEYYDSSIGVAEYSFSYGITRSFFRFDTSGLPDDCTISSAVVKIHGYSNGGDSACIQESTWSTAGLGTGDFDAFTGEAFDTISSWSSSSYNDFSLNSKGIGSISKTGTTEFCVREYEHDYLDSAPSADYVSGCYFAEAPIGGNPPVINITYSTNSAPVVDSFNVDSEGNSGWDLDNDNVTVDWVYKDVDEDSCDLYFTFKKGAEPQDPTTSNYGAMVSNANVEEGGYDLDWTDEEYVVNWSDYDGNVWVKCVAYDGTDYSDVKSDNLTNGIDGTNPDTSIMNYSDSSVGPDSIWGGSTDGIAVDHVDLYIKNTTDGFYWNGSSWISNTIWLPASANDSSFGGTNENWSYDSSNVNWEYKTYEIKANASDEAGNDDSTPANDTFTLSTDNPSPSIDLISPPNGSTDVALKPTCKIWANDTNGDNLDVTWATNESGSWINLHTNHSVVANSTVSYQYPQFNNYSETYYWKVYVNDGVTNTSEWFYFTTETSYPPVINSYDLKNNTGSKLNNATGLLTINKEYYFEINITDKNGWDDIEYVNITAWYDQSDENTEYNQTNGGNLNMFLQYKNTSGNPEYNLIWPNNEVDIITSKCSETRVNSTTRIIKIYFKPKNQVKWADSNQTWTSTENTTNDPYSWNFKISIVDQADEKTWKTDEYGVDRFTYISPDNNYLLVTVAPGEDSDTNMITVNYASNHDYNLSIYFENNLYNSTSGNSITIADNLKVLANADPNDDITSDQVFQGLGEENKIKIITTSGTSPTDGLTQEVQIQFNIQIPLGTYSGIYSSKMTTKINQK